MSGIFDTDVENAWCPGCGNFPILDAVKKALERTGKAKHEIVLVSGIGQAAKLPHHVDVNVFNGLHGRALPAAVGAKIANRALTVLVTTGDGDCYGEGGNHFLHNIRRNVDITLIVHDNQIYGLTKGQASPTTDAGVPTKVQPRGVILEPFHPLETAIALGCGFVARGVSSDSDHLTALITAGVGHRGFSLIDVLQPCVSFNKINTHEWYAKRVYKVNEDPSYNPADKAAAYQKAGEWGDRIPVGILYQRARPCYGELSGIDARIPLVDEDLSKTDIRPLWSDFS